MYIGVLQLMLGLCPKKLVEAWKHDAFGTSNLLSIIAQQHNMLQAMLPQRLQG